MFGSQLRCCCHLKNLSSNVLDLSNSSNLKNAFSGIGQPKPYSNKSGCCKDDDQIKGRRVEVWPKPDPSPPAWKAECPCEPQPTNYDPYRIKGPEILVPPLKGNPTKWTGTWTGVVWTSSDPGGERPMSHQHQQGYGNPGPQGYGQEQSSEEQPDTKETPSLLGMLKSLFGRGKKKDSDQMSPAYLTD